MIRFLKFSIYFFFIFLAVLLVLIDDTNMENERREERNKPVWLDYGPPTEGIDSFIFKSKAYDISYNGKEFYLYDNHNKNTTKSILNIGSIEEVEAIYLYIKDLDSNGRNEIIFFKRNRSMMNEIYIFYFSSEKVVKTYLLLEDDFSLALSFRKDGSLYTEDCGSRYCTTTYYKWINGELLVTGSEFAESW